MSKILTREAFENAIMTLAAIGGSTNAVIHLTAIAGRIGVKLELEDFDRIGSRLPCLVNLQPSGHYLMEDFCYAGGLPAVLRELGARGRAAQERDHRQREDDLGEQQGRALLQPRGDPPVRAAVQAGGRHRGAEGQPRSRRRGDQALGRDAGAAQAPRARGRVRGHHGLPQAHRRREPRHRRELHHGAQELRPEGLSRHGGGRQHAAAAEGAAQGDHRHGPHLRRAHERHRLRHRRPAQRAGGGGGRPARLHPERRHDRARRRTAPAARRDLGRRARRAARPSGRARRSTLRAATTGSTSTTCCRPNRGADLDFLVGRSGAAVPKDNH